ncbi:MAG TPA: alpha-amylase/4-alpha-glucanotransferase domain-containing protein [Gemmatimonadales bacterium]|nr:alpha-amylase/4-alpha-glucanotransferase domain-containing protein [Gemmatimonadales bacterium]
MTPIRFAFGLHLHQPVGNFDHVFAQHVDDVYRPLLDALADREFLPVVLHLSGPLLEWLESHEPAYLDRLGRLAADGRIEILLAGFYEPVLASLPRPDRVEQIRWMHEAVARRFGVDARGLWLTERVWEPELAADLADAGVRYALVDDRHFLVTGFAAEQLHAPFWTESDDKRLALFPIDERLRYLIPFRPPEETADYLRQLRGAGHRLAVLADDGEKFGGWPGTKEWVYGKGWLDRFMATIGGLMERGEVVLSRLDEALDVVPSGGLAYLPTASYREMESWSLPPDAALRLTRLERELGEARVAGPEGSLLRGAHWRNFLVKYPESNRMHKKMMALSALARTRGDPPAARRAIGRAQCNDAYWHGVFGGLYLPHLRDAIWRNLAEAEAALREGEGLAWDVGDLDGDGNDEVWIHSAAFSVLVSPARGGAVEEYTIFGGATNFANTLTRRREAYHDLALERAAEHAASPDGGTASIHDIEEGLRLDARPPVDGYDRALFVDSILPRGVTLEDYARGESWAILSWARRRCDFTVERRERGVEVVCTVADGRARLEKRLLCEVSGRLTVSWRWDPAAAEAGDLFATELSLAGPLRLEVTPQAEEWRFLIETVAKSERGLDRTRQGESVTLRWPVELGGASVTLAPAD